MVITPSTPYTAINVSQDKSFVWKISIPSKKTKMNAIDTAPTSPAKHLALFLKLKKQNMMTERIEMIINEVSL